MAAAAPDRLVQPANNFLDYPRRKWVFLWACAHHEEVACPAVLGRRVAVPDFAVQAVECLARILVDTFLKPFSEVAEVASIRVGKGGHSHMP